MAQRETAGDKCFFEGIGTSHSESDKIVSPDITKVGDLVRQDAIAKHKVTRRICSHVYTFANL